MEIRLTDKFTASLNTLDDEYRRKREDLRLESLRKIVDLITSGLRISTDISALKVKKRFDLSGQKEYQSYADIIYNYLVKNECGFAQLEEICKVNNYQGYYFLERGDGFTDRTGAIVIDNLIEQKMFFQHCTVGFDIVELPDRRIGEAVAPCNAMIFKDNYLFHEKGKIDQFVKFFDHYFNDNLSITFQLTIISEFKNSKIKIVEYAENKLREFKNLWYDIVLQDSKFNIDRDRLFYMNYVRGNIGHPFDKRTTTFNQYFLGTKEPKEEILKTYKEYLTRLRELKKAIAGVPDTIGSCKMRYRNEEFENRLLNHLTTNS